MLPLRHQKTVYQNPKCYFTYGSMPHVNPKQPPSKGKPWTTLASRDYIHQVDLLLPKASLQPFKTSVLDGQEATEFRRVVMTLGQILERDFFHEYIKIGNILMLSEGRPGQDNVFTIKDGTLTMFLDREMYERAGIVGDTHGAKGKRCLKPRWIVEFDLRAPSSFPGKKGFDRLVYATKNALNFPVTWLFCNLNGKTPEPDPMAPHSPTKYTASPEISPTTTVLMPPLSPNPSTGMSTSQPDRTESVRFAAETYEWLSLLRLQSPRVEAGDQIDPYLSMYRVPSGDGPGPNPGEQQPNQAGEVVKVTWRGFLAGCWAHQLLVDVLAALPSKSWFALSTTTFPTSRGIAGDGTDVTILRPPNSPGEYLQWEVKAHE